MERLRDIGESGLLARLFPVYAATTAGDFSAAEPVGDITTVSDVRPRAVDDALVGPGDDAAVVPARSGSVVVTTDSMVRGLDWRDDWSTPEDVGWKVVGQNLADVAAMGARPTSLVLALAVDPDTGVDWCVGLATGVATAAARHGVAVAGGDLSAAPPGVVVVTVTALGDLAGRPPVLRSGARPGDLVAVCGTLGRSGTGLELLQRGARRPETPDGTDHARAEAEPMAVGTGGAATEVDEEPPEGEAGVIHAHRRAPVPHLAAGPLVAGLATAMIDVSDGLVLDLTRVATASDVRIDLHRSALSSFAVPLTEIVGEDQAWRQVLGGGEEHALVATFPPDTGLDVLAGGDPTLRWVRIGTVRAASGLPEDDAPRVTVDGADAAPTGWDHFTR
ncbi:MAG: thiamine-phosphate kinase [Dermatophilaceae bacterium]